MGDAVKLAAGALAGVLVMLLLRRRAACAPASSSSRALSSGATNEPMLGHVREALPPLPVRERERRPPAGCA